MSKAFALAKSPLGALIVGLAFGTFSKLLPIQRIKETSKVVAFWHPKPFWEKHILIVPKKAISSIAALNEKHSEYVCDVFLVAAEIVEDLGWEKDGYSITINGGTRQDVMQIHFHLHSGGIVTNKG